MSRYSFVIIEINELAWGEDEYLHDSSTYSAFDAIKKCLDPAQKGDLLQVTVLQADRVIAEGFSPFANFGSWSDFQALLHTHQLAHKVQLNVDMSDDRACEELIVKAIESRVGVQN